MAMDKNDGIQVIHDGPFHIKTSDDTGWPITNSKKHMYGSKKKGDARGKEEGLLSD